MLRRLLRDDDRVDGRDLDELDEPGSDALLLRGLLLLLARHWRAEHASELDEDERRFREWHDPDPDVDEHGVRRDAAQG
jgi:hypothetical protein